MSTFASSSSAIWNSHHRGKLLLTLAVLVAVAVPFLVPPTLFIAALLGVAALPLVLYILWRIFDGSAEPVLLGWVLLFPLGYYFLSYPTDHPIVTLDRVVVAMLSIAIAFTPARKLTPAPLPLRRAALAWGAYLVAVAISMVGSPVTLFKLKRGVEGLILPALAAWYIIRSFEVRRYLRVLHALACLMIIYISCIGVAEIVLGEDLLKLPGGGIDHSGVAGHYWVRPNGPFFTNTTLGMVGLIMLVFLAFLRRALGDDLHRGQAFLHWLGVFCALACSQMVLFRSMLLTVAVIVLLEVRRPNLFRSRTPAFVLVVLTLGSLAAFQFMAPAAFAERSDPVNFWGRIAQDQQTLKLALSHPLVGVGFGSFSDSAQALGMDSASFRGLAAFDSPHNNLGSVLAETGLLGLFPYVLSHALLAMAFFRLRPRNRSSPNLVWAVFLYLFLIFWINGLSLNSDDPVANLCYMFAIACVYKYALSGPPPAELAAGQETEAV